MSKIAATRRRALWAAAALAVTIVAARESAVAQQVRPANVFDVSPSLAIEAARTRLRLFVEDNPEAVDGSVVAEQPECPLISVESFNGLAGVVAAERSADLRLQLDPWLGRTTSDPELRPDSAAAGEVAGIPIVRCDTTRPDDGLTTRPAMFAMNLTDGVTFGDVDPPLLPRGNRRRPTGWDRRPAGRVVLRHRRHGDVCRAVELAQPRPRADPGRAAERRQQRPPLAHCSAPRSRR